MEIRHYECDACHAQYTNKDSAWVMKGELKDPFGGRYDICSVCMAKLIVTTQVLADQS